jgi:hypothetical protein
MKKKSLIILSIIPLLFTGCASQKTWVYRSNSYPPAKSSTGKKVAVLAFEDARENRNDNVWGIGFIPLFPCGWQHLSSPEGIQHHATSGMWVNYKPTEDYPKALAEDLRNTGLFSDAFFDFRRESGDYAVKGKILNTKYDGYIITYGLSAYGAYLWLIGFPCASANNELSLELSLVDAKADKTLFSKVYTATPRSSVSWLYVMNNDFNYSEMLADVNKQFCNDIQPVIFGNYTPLTPDELKAAELKTNPVLVPKPVTNPQGGHRVN